MNYDLPNNYQKAGFASCPAYLKGYEHFFYANLGELLSDTDFDDWVISLFDGYGNEVAADIGVLTKYELDGTDFRFSAAFTIPEVTDVGCYELVIYNSVTEEIKYVSGGVEVIGEESAEEYVFLEFRNSSNTFNYDYDEFTEYNNVFLRMNLIDQQPEIELKRYNEQSTGYKRNQKTTTSKGLILEGFFFSNEMIDFFLALSTHDDIKLNGKIVEVKTAWATEPNKFNSSHKGKIEFYDQEYSTVNLHG